MQTQLPRRPYVELPPPPDGLVRARREGGRRRVRRAIAAFTGGVTAVALVVVAVVLIGGGGGLAVLRPAPPAMQPPSLRATEAPSAVVPAHAGGYGITGTTGRTGDGRPLTATSTAPSRTSAAPHSSPRNNPIVLTRSQSRYTGYPRVCRTGGSADNQSVQPGAEWCRDAGVVATSGGRRLSLTLCRDSSTGGTLTFNTTREVDFAVTRGGKTIWSWSHDHSGTASQHTLSAAEDGCWVWSLVWPGVTQAGDAAGHGAFTLVATTTAQELQGSPSTQVDFRY